MAVPFPTTSDRHPRPEGFSFGWTAFLLGGLILVGVVATIRATCKPLWFDEIFTLIIATLQSPAEMIKALEVPIDALPPPYYMICSAALRLIPDEHVGLRLPSLCGYLVTVACVYLFLSPRVDRISALAGAAFVTCTALADYAYEARPYALMTGSICCAACSWQRIDRSWAWAVALALSLGLAVSCHYYAVFAWPAFGLAEMLVLVCERRFRARAWLALAIGLVPFVVCWPLLANFRSVFGRTWWSPARLGLIVQSPLFLFKWSGGVWGPAETAALAALCIAWIAKLPRRAIWPKSVWFPSSPLTPGECGLSLGLLVIPIIAVFTAIICHGGMSERYTMPAIVGAAISVGALVSTAPPLYRAIAVSIMLLNYGLAERSAFVAWVNRPPNAGAGISGPCVDFIASLGTQSPPVVIENASRYVQLVHYCDSDTRSRMCAIADPSKSVEFSGGDVLDKSLQLVSPFFPVNISGYDDFIARHETFLLNLQGDSWGWLPRKLFQDGHAFALASKTAWGTIYRVTVKKP